MNVTTQNSNRQETTLAEFCDHKALGFAQQRFWMLAQFHSNSPLYNIPVALSLSGSLNTGLLQKSLNCLISRHALLRTTFTTINGMPQLQEQAPCDVHMEIIDCAETDMHTDHESLLNRLSEIARRRFDLSRNLPFRVALFKLAEQKHILLIVVHHIAIDGWSMLTLQRDLWSMYGAGLNKQMADLPEISHSYLQFTQWQRDWFTGDNLDSRLHYWKHLLQGANDDLPLTSDHSRPLNRSDKGDIVQSVMPTETAKAVRALAKKHEVTPFMVLISGFLMLLHRSGGQQDISIGIPVSNRSRLPRRWRKATREMIGLFMNTVVMRQQLTSDMTFSQLLGQVRNDSIAALAHQDLPMETLVASLQPERNQGKNPLFQVLFSVEEHPATEPNLEQLQGQEMLVHTGTAKFDLTFTLIERPGQAQIIAEYSLDLFTQETMARLIEHYKNLLAEVAQDPDRPLHSINFLGEIERQQLLYSWNNTKLNYLQNQSIDQLFQIQAAKTPDKVALTCENKQFSYAEINQRADRLAQHLYGLGIRSNKPVAIYLTRNEDLLIAILGILKAGGCWLPLDVTYPQQRLEFMLNDSQAAILLTHSVLQNQLPTGQAQVMYMDQEFKGQAQKPDDSDRHDEQMAYLMYTSGSTGKPKGVMVAHRSVVALAHWAKQQYDSDELSAVLASSNISFDASVFELLVPLLCGGSIILINSILEIQQLNQALPVSLISTVPSAMQKLLETHSLPKFPLTLNLGGEALSAKLVDKLYQHHNVKRVYDLYGPTEATVYSTCMLRKPGGTVSIGRPISNAQVYVLDRHLNLQSVGAPGELYIAGKGLALAYWKRPKLTEQKFIINPFSKITEERMYRTGDQVRFLNDGHLQFLGRLDHQIKLRGVRIELGEIESTLQQHPDINEAIVILKETNAGEKRLLAFIKPKTDKQPVIQHIKQFLKRRLPDYMIPTGFTIMEQLPLTPNFKIDRDALTTLDHPQLSSEREYASAKTAKQQTLVTIWQETLETSPISIDENFFELGGHSLLTAKLCTRIETQLGLHIPVSWIFRYPTIRLLSAALEPSFIPENSSIPTITTPIRTEGKLPPLFWFGDIEVLPVICEHVSNDQPIYLINHQAFDGQRAKHLNLSTLVNFYSDAITQIQPHGPYCLAGFSMGAYIMYEVAGLLNKQGQSIATLFLLDPSNIYSQPKKVKQQFKLNLSHLKEDLKQSSLIPFIQKKSKSIFKRLHTAYIDLLWLTYKTLRRNYHAALVEIHFFRNKPMPHHLHWNYLIRIYKRARKNYQPKPIDKQINNITLVYSNITKPQRWIRLLHHEAQIHKLDSTHSQLLKKPYSLIWIKTLARSLPDSTLAKKPHQQT